MDAARKYRLRPVDSGYLFAVEPTDWPDEWVSTEEMAAEMLETELAKDWQCDYCSSINRGQFPDCGYCGHDRDEIAL